MTDEERARCVETIIRVVMEYVRQMETQSGRHRPLTIRIEPEV